MKEEQGPAPHGRWASLCGVVLVGFVGAVWATTYNKVEQVLGLAEPPKGVVFETVSGDEAALRWALPQIRHYTKRLREHFPAIEIAVVAHGMEQFALRRSLRDKYPAVHNTLKQLSGPDRLTFHVCGTFATWNGVAADSFVPQVQVARAGPEKIEEYKARGFLHILIEPEAP